MSHMLLRTGGCLSREELTVGDGLLEVVGVEFGRVPGGESLPLNRRDLTKLIDLVSAARLFMIVHTLGWLNPASLVDSYWIGSIK